MDNTTYGAIDIPEEAKPKAVPRKDLALGELIVKVNADTAALDELKKREEQFLKTGDPKLLPDYKPEQLKGVSLKEPVKNANGRPVSIFDAQEYMERDRARDGVPLSDLSTTDRDQLMAMRNEGVEKLKADAKLLNPKVEIREVETADGSKALAFVGVESATLNAFHKLRNDERRLEREIKNNTEKVRGGLSHSFQPGSPPGNDRQHDRNDSIFRGGSAKNAGAIPGKVTGVGPREF